MPLERTAPKRRGRCIVHEGNSRKTAIALNAQNASLAQENERQHANALAAHGDFKRELGPVSLRTTWRLGRQIKREQAARIAARKTASGKPDQQAAGSTRPFALGGGQLPPAPGSQQWLGGLNAQGGAALPQGGFSVQRFDMPSDEESLTTGFGLRSQQPARTHSTSRRHASTTTVLTATKQPIRSAQLRPRVPDHTRTSVRRRGPVPRHPSDHADADRQLPEFPDKQVGRNNTLRPPVPATAQVETTPAHGTPPAEANPQDAATEADVAEVEAQMAQEAEETVPKTDPVLQEQPTTIEHAQSAGRTAHRAETRDNHPATPATATATKRYRKTHAKCWRRKEAAEGRLSRQFRQRRSTERTDNCATESSTKPAGRGDDVAMRWFKRADFRIVDQKGTGPDMLKHTGDQRMKTLDPKLAASMNARSKGRDGKEANALS